MDARRLKRNLNPARRCAGGGQALSTEATPCAMLLHDCSHSFR